jgi:hypothetical protein
LQRTVTRSVVEQEGNGVAEDLAQQPAGQMPKIFGPHSLEGVSCAELRKDGVNPVAQAAQEGAPLGGGIAFLCAVGREELYAHALSQLFSRLRRPVIAISHGETAGGLKEFGKPGKLVGVGWGHRQAGDHPRPAHPHMHPEAVEGLLEEGVLTESGFSLEAAAAIGTGEQARRQRHRVHQREGRIVGSKREELLPEVFFDLPEIGRLPSEGSAMDLAKSWEPFAVVSAEEEIDSFVGVYAEKLSDDLYGADLSVGELRSGTALADAAPFEPVVDKAEDGHDEGAKIHKKKKTSVMCSVLLG